MLKSLRPSPELSLESGDGGGDAGFESHKFASHKFDPSEVHAEKGCERLMVILWFLEAAF